MNNLESGLFLPIRFYQYMTEQDRYKPQSEGVALTELNYPYVDCKTLAPFQVKFNSLSTALGVTFTAYCAESHEAIDLAYNASHWHEYIDDNGNYYLSYLGTDDFSSDISNGLYYFKVSIQFSGETPYFYSDLVMIGNCGETPYDIDEFRLHIQNDDTAVRAIDTTDLRITK